MNPLYQSYQQQRQNNAPGLPGNMQAAASDLLAQLAMSGMTPEQKVRELIQNGQMTQQQFEMLGRMADSMMGRRR